MPHEANLQYPEHMKKPNIFHMDSIPRPILPEELPALHPRLGKPSERYVYANEKGNPLCVVYRFDNSDNSDKRPRKEFRPYDCCIRKWKAPEVRPLYRLDAVATYDGPIVLVEGEKCADALNDMGILAISAFGGCNGAGKTDFSFLKDRDVIIWPDNDEPGSKYANTATQSLRNVGARSISIVPLDPVTLRYASNGVGGEENDSPRIRNVTGVCGTIPKSWDAANAVTEGWDVERIRCLLNMATSVGINESGSAQLDEYSDEQSRNVNVTGDEFEWDEPDMSILNPRREPPEFPFQLFGPFWSKWIMAKAEGCSAPVDYVGMSLLSLLSTLIGCSRFVSPWEGWKEPPMLWVALVGNPSSGKSPALESVLGIARKIEQEGAEGLKEQLREYEADALAAQCLRQDWERQVKEATKGAHPIPPMPENAQVPVRPERPRIIASDTTPEALARLLSVQPKGLLITRDELAGWLGSFNRYSGGQGGDRAFWLEAYGGRPYVIDRARNGGEAVTVPSLAASIVGGIQPDKLQSLLLSGDDDGLTARILFCWPEPVPLERPQRVAESHEADTALRWLNSLCLIPDGSGGLSHGLVRLEEGATVFFQEWRKEHGANQPEGSIASWWGKMPGVCLRLALCFEYMWLASTTRQETFSVSYPAVEAATVMIEQYLKPMAQRAYGDAALPLEEKNAAIVANWIRANRVTQINTRKLQREIRLPGLRCAYEIEGATELLCQANWLQPTPRRQGKSFGRKTKDFDVCDKVHQKTK